MSGNDHPLCIDLHSLYQSEPTIDKLFAETPGLLEELRRRLNPSSGGGEFLLISSTMYQGKTTIAKLVLDHIFADQSNDDPVPLLHIGLQEYLMPEGISPHVEDDFQTWLDKNEWPTEQFIVIEDVRTPEMASKALKFAKAGANVIAVLHAVSANQAILRLRALVNAFGSGDELNDILKSGQLMSLHNEFDPGVTSPQP
ncbi:hypothetical protein A1D17_02535 [Pseudomonas fluorescens]|uniref:Uncharacterized protein n=2 Tax=Pseudomonas TaxID=286 RepID=A0A162B1U6_PSEFL|nr:hypothetical protein A1D17_02535 [Pseudomonas fluorescens]